MRQREGGDRCLGHMVDTRCILARKAVIVLDILVPIAHSAHGYNSSQSPHTVDVFPHWCKGMFLASFGTFTLAAFRDPQKPPHFTIPLQGNSLSASVKIACESTAQ